MNLPDEIKTLEQLEQTLAIPPQPLIDMMRRLEGDIMILGIAGKIGKSLGRQAVNAIREAGVQKKVIGVARFSHPEDRAELDACGIETIACDLTDREAVAKLPQCPNIIYMAGRKFGTDGSEALTWAMNILPAYLVGEHFRNSRIVAFSTGCVYPLVPLQACGCTEEIPPAPVGEYSQSCLGRERIFQYCAQTYGTKVLRFRLNYAIDLRYGVLNDIARPIWEGRPVNNTVGFFNVIWQGDVTAAALRCLEMSDTSCPVLNITGPETASVEKTALEFGRLLGKPVAFQGTPGGIGYMNDASLMCRKLGYPTVSLKQMIQWQAAWIRNGGVCIGKPTHFEVNTGKF